MSMSAEAARLRPVARRHTIEGTKTELARWEDGLAVIPYNAALLFNRYGDSLGDWDLLTLIRNTASAITLMAFGGFWS